MSENTLKSLEERMDAQLIAFGAMPEDYYEPGYPVVNKKYRSDMRKKRAGVLAGAGVATLAGAAAYKNKDALLAGGRKAVQGAGGGLQKAGGYLRHQGTLTNNIKAGGLMGKAGRGIADVGKKLKGLSRAEADAVIELAERIAEIELEAAEDEHDFGRVDDLQRYKDQMAVAAASGKVKAKAAYGAAKGKVQGAYSQAAPKLQSAYGTAKVRGAALAGTAKARGGALAGNAKGAASQYGRQASGWVKANPKLALKAGGVGLLAGGVMAARVKHDRDKKKRREELVARFKGGRPAQA